MEIQDYVEKSASSTGTENQDIFAAPTPSVSSPLITFCPSSPIHNSDITPPVNSDLESRVISVLLAELEDLDGPNLGRTAASFGTVSTETPIPPIHNIVTPSCTAYNTLEFLDVDEEATLQSTATPIVETNPHYLLDHFPPESERASEIGLLLRRY